MTFIDAKYRVAEHILHKHVPLDESPYYCTLCLFKAFKWEQLLKHKANHPRHNQLQKSQGVKDCQRMYRASKKPYQMTERDMAPLSSKASRDFWAAKKVSASPDPVTAAMQAADLQTLLQSPPPITRVGMPEESETMTAAQAEDPGLSATLPDEPWTPSLSFPAICQPNMPPTLTPSWNSLFRISPPATIPSLSASLALDTQALPVVTLSRPTTGESNRTVALQRTAVQSTTDTNHLPLAAAQPVAATVQPTTAGVQRPKPFSIWSPAAEIQYSPSLPSPAKESQISVDQPPATIWSPTAELQRARKPTSANVIVGGTEIPTSLSLSTAYPSMTGDHQPLGVKTSVAAIQQSTSQPLPAIANTDSLAGLQQLLTTAIQSAASSLIAVGSQTKSETTRSTTTQSEAVPTKPTIEAKKSAKGQEVENILDDILPNTELDFEDSVHGSPGRSNSPSLSSASAMAPVSKKIEQETLEAIRQGIENNRKMLETQGRVVQEFARCVLDMSYALNCATRAKRDAETQTEDQRPEKRRREDEGTTVSSDVRRVRHQQEEEYNHYSQRRRDNRRMEEEDRDRRRGGVARRY